MIRKISADTANIPMDAASVCASSSIVASTTITAGGRKVATTASPREITGEESDFINPVF